MGHRHVIRGPGHDLHDWFSDTHQGPDHGVLSVPTFQPVGHHDDGVDVGLLEIGLRRRMAGCPREDRSKSGRAQRLEEVLRISYARSSDKYP